MELEGEKCGYMKKLLTLTMLLIVAGTLRAQTDVTRFLGIPVDGSKTEMIQKLKEKGFRSPLLYQLSYGTIPHE